MVPAPLSLQGRTASKPSRAACCGLLSSWMCYLVVHIVPFKHAFLFSSQGMAFTLQERLQLGIHGLLPPCFLSQNVQVLRVLRNYEKQSNDLDRYVRNILLSPSSPCHFQFFKDPRKTWGSCFKTCRFPSVSPFSYSPAAGVFILACQPSLHFLPSQFHSSTDTAFFLPPHCWGALVLAQQFAIPWVEVHTKKVLPAPEHWRWSEHT